MGCQVQRVSPSRLQMVKLVDSHHMNGRVEPEGTSGIQEGIVDEN